MIARLGAGGNGGSPAAKSFEREENVYQSQPRDRAAQIGIFHEEPQAGILIEEVVGFPELGPGDQNQHQSHLEPDQEEHNAQQAVPHELGIMGDYSRSGNSWRRLVWGSQGAAVAREDA